MTEEQVIEEQVTGELTDEQKQAEETARIAAEEAERKEQEETEKKPWFKKRLDEITRQKYAEKTAREAAEKRAKELEERLSKLEKKPDETKTDFGTAKPKLADFVERAANIDEAYEAHAEAMADWKLKQYEAKRQQEEERRKAEAQRQRQLETFEQKRLKTVRAGQEQYPDWQDVVIRGIPEAIMTDHLANAIVDMENGAKVAYYLGKNLQEAERISQMSPYALAAELGRIDAKLTTTEKRQSKAPPPVQTIKGTVPPGNELDPDKNPNEWVKARNEGRI